MRRIYSGPGKAYRAVEKLAAFANEGHPARNARAPSRHPLRLPEAPRGELPAREEFFVAAPAVVEAKAGTACHASRKMVGYRRSTAARQGLEGPGQDHDYRAGERDAHGTKF